MRKPVFLAVVGFSIVVAAVSLGVSLTRFLGLVAYSPNGSAQVSTPPAGIVAPAPPPEDWNNLFAPQDGMKLASRLSAADAKAGSPATHSNFMLMGTIVSSSPALRRAILWANGMKEPKAFREKEEVEPGAYLASIERDVAWITRGGDREKLEIVPVGSRVPNAGASAAVPRVGPASEAAVSVGKLPRDDEVDTLTRAEQRQRSRRHRK